MSNDHVDLDETAGTRLPEHPTKELPGTPEKIVVMTERAERREILFHPRDAKRSLGKKPDEEKAA